MQALLKGLHFAAFPAAAALMPYAHKLMWQDVLRKTPYKLKVAQTHHFGFAAIFIIFVAKAYTVLTDLFYPMIAYGYFVSVATKLDRDKVFSWL